MENYICVTCGTRYPTTESAPERCPICEDERQYVGRSGQQWTTMDELRKEHHNAFRELAPVITAILTETSFGIGQQAYLIQTAASNVLWDCVTLLDDDTIAGIEQRGGLQAMALSHPHFFTSINAWSRAFGGVPIYIHQDNSEWVVEMGDAVTFWEGETLDMLPGSGLTLIRCGGHFPGSTVLHWAAGLDGAGALFSGDTIQVMADPHWVSFMYSYPNAVPLSAPGVQAIVGAVRPFAFERIYGAFGVVQEDGNGTVERSAGRYIRAIGG